MSHHDEPPGRVSSRVCEVHMPSQALRKVQTVNKQVADLKRLGARVVAADASSLILATGKANLTAAVGCAPAC